VQQRAFSVIWLSSGPHLQAAIGARTRSVAIRLVMAAGLIAHARRVGDGPDGGNVGKSKRQEPFSLLPLACDCCSRSGYCPPDGPASTSDEVQLS
jgi:hypothetical protein